MALLPLVSAFAALSIAAIGKPKVMVLGTFHFANPGLDAVKVSQRDILGKDRQEEVLKVVAELAKFEPTKVFVESTPERQAEIDTAYSAFLNGTPLSSNEIQQIGFRLAKHSNLKSLTGVDYPAPMDFDSVMKFAAENGMGDVPQKVMSTAEKLGKIMTEWDRKYTVGQILAIHNSEPMIRAGQSFYTAFLGVGRNPDYPGADMVAGWYRRNLVIYQNIASQLKPGDRAIVIYGSGHAYYLNQLFQDGGTLDFVKASSYLPKPPITKFPDL